MDSEDGLASHTHKLFAQGEKKDAQLEKLLGRGMMSTGPPPLDPNKNYVNPGTDDQMEVCGYKKNVYKTTAVWFFVLVTVGFLRLVFYWKPHWMLILTHDKTSLTACNSVLLCNHYKEVFVARVSTVDIKQSVDFGSIKGEGRVFRCKKMRYIWDAASQQFIQIAGLRLAGAGSCHMTCKSFKKFTGLTRDEQNIRCEFYGPNVIEVHVTPILTLLFKECLNPFYVFQLFSICLWISDQYYYYSMAIIIMSVMSIIITIYQTRKMQRQLKRTISSSTMVTVKRPSLGHETMHSQQLSAGDVIAIPRKGCVLQCDVVLMSGNCVMNESMLTGESVPVTKTPLPDNDTHFNFHTHAGHILFSGTQVLQTRCARNEPVHAVVVRTGFATSKGELVRAIMYPKPVDFKFERDSYYFIAILSCVAVIGFIYTIVLMKIRNDAVSEIVIRALDLFTIAVPPALPAAMSVGVMYALIRLKHSGIYCISPRSINVCGAINTICFDKTGTLTEDGLDFHSVVSASSGMFLRVMQTAEKISDRTTLECMATCHSLTIIDGVLSGDPIDLIMFHATGWQLEEPNETDSRFGVTTTTLVRPIELASIADVGVIRQLTFSSELQRMSVITVREGCNNFHLYTKGSPEKIISLCKPETVPHNSHAILQDYTKKGYRVIALATRELSSTLTHTEAMNIDREKLEKHLKFVGLLVTENRLKPETHKIIHELQSAAIRTVMLTGDNILTAVSVAKECGMIPEGHAIILVNAIPDVSSGEYRLEFQYAAGHDKMSKVMHEKTTYTDSSVEIGGKQSYHFAILGSTWETLRKNFPLLVPKILLRCTVFARMTPAQKTQVVQYLQELGYYVCMCGDGANDCGALKAAHAGIALTDAEASVASPFTSSQQNIACVPELIRNGRCALVTSVGIFKFMSLYSIIMFTSVCLLYWISSNLSDLGFLYIDLGLITPFSVFFGRTGVYNRLVKEPPSASLVSIASILSLLLHTLLQGIIQVLAFFYVRIQPWYTSYEGVGHDYVSYENATIFLLSCYQYIVITIVFSKGAPYRKMIFSNYLLMANIVLSLVFTIYINVGDPSTVPKLEIKDLPHIEFKLLILGFAGLYFFLAMLLESTIIDSQFVKGRLQEALDKCCTKAQYAYETLEDDLASSPDWPPLTSHDIKILDMAVLPGGDNHVDDDISVKSETKNSGPNFCEPNFPRKNSTSDDECLELGEKAENTRF